MRAGKLSGVLLLFLAASTFTTVKTFESYFKFRINQDFIKNVFQKNMGLIFSEASRFDNVKNVYLEDIRTDMENIDLSVVPERGALNWNDLKLEMMVDEGQILLEMHDLYFVGKGVIEDPRTKAKETIDYNAPISTCQILLSLGEEYAAWGSLYPRINVDQVSFAVQEDLIKVSASGEVPLYKSHEFEKSVKKWFVQQLNKRQNDFKVKLQEAEKNLWKNFPFSTSFINGVTLNSSLSESLKFQGDSVQASFINEFDTGLDYSEFEKQLVSVKPTFSNSNDFKKDIQFTVDENLVNHFLMGLFYSKRTYSLLEEFLRNTPGELSKIASTAANLFTTTLLRPLIPNLAREVGDGKKVDFKCGFSKQFLTGKLDDTHISQVWFKKGNQIDTAFHFGCGIFHSAKAINNPLALLSSFDPESEEWIPWRSFFISVSTSTVLDFNSNMVMKGLLTGKVKSFNVDIQQLKVFKGEKLIEAESTLMEDQIRDFAESLNNYDIGSIFDKIPILQGIPIAPQSSTLKCLGLSPTNAMAEVEDRFIRIAYDFKVSTADKKCVFEVFESDDDKFGRWGKESEKKNMPDLKQVLGRAQKSIKERYEGYRKGGGGFPDIGKIIGGF